MDSVTQTIVNYIEQTDVTNREDLLSVARIAFLDYLASLAPAETNRPFKIWLGSSGLMEKTYLKPIKLCIMALPPII